MMPGAVWFISMGIAAVVAVVVWFAWRTLRQMLPERDERQHQIIRLTNAGKLSAQEAGELLRSLGIQPSADTRPVREGTLASMLGAIVVTIGFILPWTADRIGADGGIFAWVILLLGILPAVLACVPAWDPLIRQAMLRTLLSAVGIIFTGAIAVYAGGDMRVGIPIVLIGFIVEFTSGTAESRPALTGARENEAVSEAFADLARRLREEASKKTTTEEDGS